jgi:hypothetical protein
MIGILAVRPFSLTSLTCGAVSYFWRSSLEAFSMLARLVKGNAEYSGDVDRALKSALLDEIDRELHTTGKDG